MVKIARAANLKLFLAALLGVFIRRRSRIATALLAVSLGATAFFGMLAIYYDMPRRLAEVFRAYGANIILIGENGVSKEDLSKIKELAPQGSLVGAAPYMYKSMRLNQQPITTAYSDLEQAFAINPYWQLNGTFPKNANEAIAGVDLANALKLEIGSVTELEAREVNISAIVKTGGGGDGFLYMNIGDDYAADLAELSVSLSGEALEELRALLAS